MEFDKDNAPVNDDQRRLAEAKKLTLEPLHANITPEEASDSEVVARHLAGPAIQNAPNDVEQSSRLIQPIQKNTTKPAAPKPAHYTFTRLATGLAVMLCAGVTLYVLLLSQ